MDIDIENQPARQSRPRQRRPGLPTGLESRERSFNQQSTENGNDASDALLQRLRDL